MDRTKPWRSYPIVVVDVESTGLDPETDRVVELAAVRFEPTEDGYRIAGTVASLVNPGRPIPEEASSIHGITDAMVADAPPFADVWAKVLGLFDENTVAAAYNAAFDRGFLRAEHERIREDLRVVLVVPAGLRTPWLDPLVWVRATDRYASGRGRHKLAVTCERWGITLEDGHKAEDDAIAAGRLLTSPRMRQEVAALVSGRSMDFVRSVGVQDPILGAVQHRQGQLAAEHEEEHRRFRQKADADRGKTTQCKSCKAAIVWVTMEGSGKPMPLDVTPDRELGTIVVSDDGKTGKVLSGIQLAAARSEGRLSFVSHFATCAQAAQHRAPRR